MLSFGIDHDGAVVGITGYILLIANGDHEIELLRRVHRDLNIREPLFVAQSGEDALRLLDEHPNILLILLDLKLPKMSGLELLPHIRSRSKFSHVPVVVFVSDEMPGVVESVYEKGANSCLAKPVAYEEMRETLAKAFDYWLVVNRDPARTPYIS